jgi:hypothetical protein
VSRPLLEYRSQRLVSSCRITSDIDRELGSPAMSWIGQNSDNRHPSSKESMSEARGWLQSYIEPHDLCKVAQPGFMPTRLLKIEGSGDDLKLSLEDTKPDNNSYK